MNEDIPLINWCKHTAESPVDQVPTVSKRVTHAEAKFKNLTNPSINGSISGESKSKQGKGKSKVTPVQGPPHTEDVGSRHGQSGRKDNRENSDHDIINIPGVATAMVSNSGDTYVHTYLHMMFITGLSPYDRNRTVEQQETGQKKGLRIIQKASK